MSTLPLPYINRCTQCVSVLRIRINLTQVQMEPDPAFRKIKKSNQLFKNGKTFLKVSLQVQMFHDFQKKNSDKGPIKIFRSGNMQRATQQPTVYNIYTRWATYNFTFRDPGKFHQPVSPGSCCVQCTLNPFRCMVIRASGYIVIRLSPCPSCLVPSSVCQR